MQHQGEQHKFPDCSGVILAGGLNTRFQGHHKALARIDGRNLLDMILRVFTGLFEEIILVTNHPAQYVRYDLRIVTDLLSCRSSLTGIHAGLFYATRPHIFVSACDTPFLNRNVAAEIIGRIRPGDAAVIPQTPGGLEPLCAVYARRSLPIVERHLQEGKFKIQRVFGKKRMRLVPESILRRLDPELASFFNINTPQDLEQARLMTAAAGPAGAGGHQAATGNGGIGK